MSRIVVLILLSMLLSATVCTGQVTSAVRAAERSILSSPLPPQAKIIGEVALAIIGMFGPYIACKWFGYCVDEQNLGY
ncbi:MAG: hypothetical protein A4E49_02547 [Methanosaeta sp. PtaU1.Bin112]|nr:MAG: hypothetical protein A4E49_02547 [Methanosaeta sp. PtaU1.Bin112]